MVVASSDHEQVTIVGAGPTGALAAILLAKRGYRVRVFEYREDPRGSGATGGHAAEGLTSSSLAKVADAAKRSINLTLSHRGLSGLKRAGLDEEALKLAVPVRGRMIHDKEGNIALQQYDPDPERVMYSIGREVINKWLLAQLSDFEKHGQVELHFGHKCVRVGADGSATFSCGGKSIDVGPGRLLGCDGSFSKVREQMSRSSRLSVSVEYIAHGYKELAMPAGPNGTHVMPAEGLHIWPGSESTPAMLIALPNIDGSFTCTIFGDFGFLESLTSEDAVKAFFAKTWPDALTYMPDLPRQYLRNPNAALGTVRCHPWHLNGKVLLLGDAAHGVVPFYGQGMNCAFEDCLLLDEALAAHADDWAAALPPFATSRKRATDALAQLAIDNYEEMRDKTVDPLFLLKVKFHEALHAVLGEKWQPSLHSAVTFTSMPYQVAKATCEWQDRMLVRGLVGLGAIGALAVGAGARAALRAR